MVWIGVSAPRCASWLNAVTVMCFSLITYAKRPFGWNAKWRGPEPGSTDANGGSAGSSEPASLAEAVDPHLVEAEVRDVREAVGGVEVDRVRPRPDRRVGGGVRRDSCWTKAEAGFSVPSALIGSTAALPPP